MLAARRWTCRASRVLAMVIVLAVAGLADIGRSEQAGAQANEVCAIQFAIHEQSVEALPGDQVVVPYTVTVTLAGVVQADVSISVTPPPGTIASVAPSLQTLTPGDPSVESSFSIDGTVLTTIPHDAEPGTELIYSNNLATAFCLTGGDGEPRVVFSSANAPDFRIVVGQGEEPTPTFTSAPTATATATATSVPTATPTATPSPTAISTPTSLPTPTNTATATSTATASATPVTTAQASATPPRLSTPTPTATRPAPATATRTSVPAASPTAVELPEDTPTPAPELVATIPVETGLVLEISESRFR